jgi:hypothetical protein
METIQEVLQLDLPPGSSAITEALLQKTEYLFQFASGLQDTISDT